MQPSHYLCPARVIFSRFRRYWCSWRKKMLFPIRTLQSALPAEMHFKNRLAHHSPPLPTTTHHKHPIGDNVQLAIPCWPQTVQCNRTKISFFKHNIGGLNPFEKLKLAPPNCTLQTMCYWSHPICKCNCRLLTHSNAIVLPGETRTCYHIKRYPWPESENDIYNLDKDLVVKL